MYKNPLDGKMPIGSKRLQERNRRKRTLRYFTKILFFGGAIGLIVIAALRFSTLSTESIHQAFLNFFYLIFGIVIVLAMLNFQKITKQIRFINYNWGKCLFCLFLSTLSYSGTDEPFVQYLVAVYFLICCLCFAALSYFDSVNDKRQHKRDMLLLT